MQTRRAILFKPAGISRYTLRALCILERVQPHLEGQHYDLGGRPCDPDARIATWMGAPQPTMGASQPWMRPSAIPVGAFTIQMEIVLIWMGVSAIWIGGSHFWMDASYLQVSTWHIGMGTSPTGMGAPPIGMAGLPLRIVALQPGMPASPIGKGASPSPIAAPQSPDATLARRSAASPFRLIPPQIPLVAVPWWFGGVSEAFRMNAVGGGRRSRRRGTSKLAGGESPGLDQKIPSVSWNVAVSTHPLSRAGSFSAR